MHNQWTPIEERLKHSAGDNNVRANDMGPTWLPVVLCYYIARQLAGCQQPQARVSEM